MKKQTICGLVAGLMMIPATINAKYECTGAKGIVGTGYGITRNIQHMYQDLDGDFKADIVGVYLFDKGCFRKIREYKPDTETEADKYINDMTAIEEYSKVRDSLKRRE